MKIVENRKKFFITSLCIIIISICFGIYNMATGKGVFNLDVDFSGGSSMEYEIGQEAGSAEIQKIVADSTGFSSPRVQKVIGNTQVTIKMQAISVEQRDKLNDALKTVYPNSELLGFSEVSSTISSEMQQKALTAIVISCVAMLIYISIRFKDMKMGASAIAALIHDVLVLVAVYIIFRVPVNNSFIAAVLTILGYSINATIVIFDRIRENRKFVRRSDMEKLINLSVNQTLSRTINTSITTLLAITCVYIFGVTSVREFAFPLIVGIISGAYSSAFFAGSVWYSISTGKRTGKAARA